MILNIHKYFLEKVMYNLVGARTTSTIRRAVTTKLTTVYAASPNFLKYYNLS